MTKIVVVGAGVIGASVAWRLSQAGVDVTILEKFRPGTGSSGLSFAWPNAHDKQPEAYYDLNVAGMDAHAELLDEWKDARWPHLDGHFEWYLTEEGLARQRARIDRIAARGYPAEWVDGRTLKRMEPDLDPGIPDDYPVAWFSKEGWIDPVIFIGSMISGAVRNGAKLLRARATELVIAGGKVTGVQTVEHGVIPCDVVVNCSGPDLNSVTSETALHVPLKSTPGLTVITPPLPLDVKHMLHNEFWSMRPDGAGRLLVHSVALDREVDPATAVASPDFPTVVKLMDYVRDSFPGIGEVLPEAIRIGWRPVPGDGHPAVGPVPGVEGYYVVVTHSGVTLSGLLGKLVTREVTGGGVEPLLQPFRPARFFAAS